MTSRAVIACVRARQLGFGRLGSVEKLYMPLTRFIRNVVCTGDAPNAIGPYSQAVRGGGFIFVSGQLALNPVTRQIIEGDPRQQTERAFRILPRSSEPLDQTWTRSCDAACSQKHQRLRGDE